MPSICGSHSRARQPWHRKGKGGIFPLIMRRQENKIKIKKGKEKRRERGENEAKLTKCKQKFYPPAISFKTTNKQIRVSEINRGLRCATTDKQRQGSLFTTNRGGRSKEVGGGGDGKDKHNKINTNNRVLKTEAVTSTCFSPTRPEVKSQVNACACGSAACHTHCHVTYEQQCPGYSLPLPPTSYPLPLPPPPPPPKICV